MEVNLEVSMDILLWIDYNKTVNKDEDNTPDYVAYGIASRGSVNDKTIHEIKLRDKNKKFSDEEEETLYQIEKCTPIIDLIKENPGSRLYCNNLVCWTFLAMVFKEYTQRFDTKLNIKESKVLKAKSYAEICGFQTAASRSSRKQYLRSAALHIVKHNYIKIEDSMKEYGANWDSNMETLSEQLFGYKVKAITGNKEEYTTKKVEDNKKNKKDTKNKEDTSDKEKAEVEFFIPKVDLKVDTIDSVEKPEEFRTAEDTKTEDTETGDTETEGTNTEVADVEDTETEDTNDINVEDTKTEAISDQEISNADETDTVEEKVEADENSDIQLESTSVDKTSDTDDNEKVAELEIGDTFVLNIKNNTYHNKSCHIIKKVVKNKGKNARVVAISEMISDKYIPCKKCLAGLDMNRLSEIVAKRYAEAEAETNESFGAAEEDINATEDSNTVEENPDIVEESSENTEENNVDAEDTSENTEENVGVADTTEAETQEIEKIKQEESVDTNIKNTKGRLVFNGLGNSIIRAINEYGIFGKINDNTAIIETVAGDWKFNYLERPIKLYHKNFYKGEDHAEFEGYHLQEEKFKSPISVIHYILRHDNAVIDHTLETLLTNQ